MSMYSEPFQLIQIGSQPEGDGAAVRELAEKLCFGRRIRSEVCRDLICLYAELPSSGFCPSAQFLAEWLQVTKKTVFAARKTLDEKGLIHLYKEEKVVLIDWDRLKALAMCPTKELANPKGKVIYPSLTEYGHRSSFRRRNSGDTGKGKMNPDLPPSYKHFFKVFDSYPLEEAMSLLNIPYNRKEMEIEDGEREREEDLGSL